MVAECHCWQYCFKYFYICRTHTSSEHQDILSPPGLECTCQANTGYFADTLIKEEEFVLRYSQDILSLHSEYFHPEIRVVVSGDKLYPCSGAPCQGTGHCAPFNVSLWRGCVNVSLLVKQSHLQLLWLNEHKSLRKPRSYRCLQKILLAYPNTERHPVTFCKCLLVTEVVSSDGWKEVK